MSSNKLGWLKVKPITDRELIRRCYHAFVVGPSLCVPTIHSTDRGLARKREVLRARGLTERTCAHFLSTAAEKSRLGLVCSRVGTIFLFYFLYDFMRANTYGRNLIAKLHEANYFARLA